MVLDVSANVVPLTVQSTLAIISFIALDTNGSILVAGVFEKAMNTIFTHAFKLLKIEVYSVHRRANKIVKKTS